MHTPLVPTESADLTTGRTVLAVDDDPTVLRWLSAALPKLGYVVITAIDPDAAQRILATVHIDALLVDLHLGEHSGVDLLAFVRGHATLCCLPILMLTGVTQMSEFEEESIRRHRAYVFYKPAPIADLANTLARALSDAG